MSIFKKIGSIIVLIALLPLILLFILVQLAWGMAEVVTGA